MYRVGVIGATGYAGAELVRILSGHPDVALTVLTSRQYANVKFTEVYPSLTGLINLTCEAFEPEAVAAKADIFFLALPHQLPMNIVPKLLEYGKQVIDLSADFRFTDVDRYEKYYQPHTAPHLLEKAVYGLCEIYADQIKAASLIGNPGCYPTSILLPLMPFIQNRMINLNSIIADSKSGVSGAGRSPSLTVHFCEVNESFKAYKVMNHRHTPEIEEILSLASGSDVAVTFVPHLVPMTRGMLSTIYADLTVETNLAEIRECLRSFYATHRFIRIVPENTVPDTRNVSGSNFCDIGCQIDTRRNRLIMIAAIDNLIKGAAGQAVQNMNLMLGLEETTGLLSAPMPL